MGSSKTRQSTITHSTIQEPYMSVKPPKYQYNSLLDIDEETLDYLSFVIPGGDVYKTPIDDVNTFLNELDTLYEELEQQKEVA